MMTSAQPVYLPVCYVCGSGGAQSPIYIKPRVKGPYFPFLEHHEPPNGAAHPTTEGAVQACNVCSAFLQQQWESFERNKTPLIKRLYWLKRCDNRTFTGAEMHLQGEYVSQMLGLQYVPGTYSCGDNTPPEEASGHVSPLLIGQPQVKQRSFDMDDNGALDLSVAAPKPKTASTSSEPQSPRQQTQDRRTCHNGLPTVYCFLCKTKQPESLMRFIYTKKNAADEAYFSFLFDLAEASCVNITSAGLTRVCSNCRKTLHRQWRGFEASNTPEEMRIYHIKDKPVNLDHIKQRTKSDGKDRDRSKCFVCAKVVAKSELSHLRSCRSSSSPNEPFFPFLMLHPVLPGVKPMDAHGQVMSCKHCKDTLMKEWAMYDAKGVQEEYRNYSLRFDPSGHASAEMQASAVHQQMLKVHVSSPNMSMYSPTSNEGLLAIAPYAYQRGVVNGLSVEHASDKTPNVKEDKYDDKENTPRYEQDYSEVRVKTEVDALSDPPVDAAAENSDVDVDGDDDDDENAFGAAGPLTKMEDKTSAHEDGRRGEGLIVSPVSSPSPSNGDLSDTENTGYGNHHKLTVEVGDHDDMHSDQTGAPGLPQGPKPPPLSMLSPAAAKVTRTTATVPPMNQVSPGSSSTSGSSSSVINASRQSSFAAALRKLAKQAIDPPDVAEGSGYKGENSYDNSTSGSSQSSRRTPTPKRGSTHPQGYSIQQAGGLVNTPPVVTIAPTPSHPSLVTSDGRKSTERPNTGSSHSGSVIEAVSVKQEHRGSHVKQEPERMMQPLALNRQSEERAAARDSIASSRNTPLGSVGQGVMSGTAGLGGREDLHGRGFQPYRAGDDMRPMPAHYGMDPAMYPYHAAYMAQHAAAFSHPAFRMDDPILMERYRLMQASPFFSYPHPSMMPSAAAAGLGYPYPPGAGYPPELLRHQPLVSPGTKPQDLTSPHLAGSDRSLGEHDSHHESRRDGLLDRERPRERDRERDRERERAHEHERERHHDDHHRLSGEKDYMTSHHTHHHHKALERPKSNSHIQSHGQTMTNHYSQKPKETFHKREPPEKDSGHHSKQSHRTLDLNMKDKIKEKLPEQLMKNGTSSARIVSPKAMDLHTNHYKASSNNFHRPFENAAVNGMDHNHWVGRNHSMRLMPSKGSHEGPKDLRHPGRQESGAPTQDASKVPLGKPALSQHYEGMPKHLYDPEKYHTVSSTQPSTPNPSSVIMAPSGPPINHLKNLHNLTLGKHGDFGVHLSRSLEESRPGSERSQNVVSKLDLEEKKLREARKNGSYHSDDSDNDTVEEYDKKRERLLLIQSGPPLKLDQSPVKMNFLQTVGLTSQEEKKELTYLKQCNRRQLLGEPPQQPLKVVEEKSPTPLVSTIDPDELNKEPDYNYKTHFLFLMGLHSVVPERRKEMDVIRTACEQDQLRRERAFQASKAVRLLQQEKAVKSEQKHEESSSQSPLKRKLSESEATEPRPQRPRSSSIPETLADHQKDQASIPLLSSSSQSSSKTQDLPANQSQSVIQSTNKDPSRMMSQQFAQEFHKSVLQSTRQQELSSKRGSGTRGCTSPGLRPGSADNKRREYLMVPPSHSHRKHARTEVKEKNDTFKWPGIEAVLESYQKYVEEQSLEKQVLMEQCDNLRQHNQQLNQNAEALSRKMGEMLQNKERLEKERVHCQRGLDLLKKYLTGLR